MQVLPHPHLLVLAAFLTVSELQGTDLWALQLTGPGLGALSQVLAGANPEEVHQLFSPV